MAFEPVIKVIFWLSAISIIYAYIGYPLLIAFFALFVKKSNNPSNHDQPEVTLFVTAFNEEDFVIRKIENSKQLNYPSNKLKYIWVTDGSTDRTNELLARYPDIKVYFEPERKGKIHAMKRGMQFADTEIIVFTDANTLINPESISIMIELFTDPQIGCVAGEKRILLDHKGNAAASGEGFYWKYESWVKKHDAIIGSTIGAAGELFAFRKELYQPVADDAILDDFEISLRIAMNGYKIGYSPDAYAIERPSVNVGEEMKRKVRIAAGSIQAMVRLTSLFNLFRHPLLSFQYVSHKVFRWIVTPVALVLLIPANIILAIQESFSFNSVYTVLLLTQILFYIAVVTGAFLRNKNTIFSVIFIPYYFYLANIAMWQGFFRYWRKQQSVKWERAERAKE
jgi:cellulose synthase/poly-beta-1,6-N-acetylglucosamine synthase-like glycosyltransferase